MNAHRRKHGIITSLGWDVLEKQLLVFPTFCWWCSFIWHQEREVGNTVSICSKFSPSTASQLDGYWGGKGREGLLYQTSVQSGLPDSEKCEALPYSDWGRANLHLDPKGILGSLGNWLFWSFVNSSVKPGCGAVGALGQERFVFVSQTLVLTLFTCLYRRPFWTKLSFGSRN